MTALRAFLAKRPTEAASGLGLALAVFGFLTQAGADSVASAAVGLAVGCGPAFMSAMVSAARGGKS